MSRMQLPQSPVSGEFSACRRSRLSRAIACLILISVLSTFAGVPAHHTIANSWSGLLWGLAHPVIGLDRLVTVIAIGLLSAGVVGGATLPLSFVLATICGTDIHLFQINLPSAEIAIAFSTIVFSAILAIPNRPNWLLLLVLSATAGLFHGYTYGESIIGTEITPLIAYVSGITLTQYVVAMSAKVIYDTMHIREFNQISYQKKMHLAGFAFCAIGIVIASKSIM
ncbi:MAG: HupE/UreJ family protein [Heteroscytonema crispum UTEX LB 1556]